MSYNQLYYFLTNILNEPQLSLNILFMAHPCVSNNIKRDLSTFVFTWNIIREPIYKILQLNFNINDPKLYSHAPYEITNYYIEAFENVAKKTDFSFIPYKTDQSVQYFINYIKKYLLSFNRPQRLLVMKHLGFL